MIVTVTACVDCPMYLTETDCDEAACNHPEARSQLGSLGDVQRGIPGWCPLRDEPLHVYLAPQKLKPIEGAP